jgi:hypothetical protein
MNNDDIIKEVDLILDSFLDIYADGGDWDDFKPGLEVLANRALMSEKRINEALKFLKFVKKNVDPNIIIQILEG